MRTVQGYLYAKNNLDILKNLDTIADKKFHSEEKTKMEENLRIFRNKCEAFSTAAEKIAKIVWGKNNIQYLQWKERKFHFDKWILTSVEKKQINS